MECLQTETRVSLNFKHINTVMYWLVDENVTRVSPTNSKQLDSVQVPQTFFFFCTISCLNYCYILL